MTRFLALTLITSSLSATLKYDEGCDKYYRYPYDHQIDAEEYDALAHLALSQIEIVMEDEGFRENMRSRGASRFVKKVVPEVTVLLKKINTYTALQCANDIEEFERIPAQALRNWHCVLD